MPGDLLELRRITPADWRSLRHLRLAALLDEPMAYCERWADAAALDDDAWQARAVRGADGGDAFQVMAWDGARPVATAVGFVAEHASLGTPVAWLVGVHVAPDVRGRGLLERLVDAIVAWAREQGATSLHLEVHEANARAQAAYRRLGFADTGRRRPYPLDPTAVELELARPL
ncbi:MAG: GNAT family N-acetyltransferase [Actinomycetes bacterium]